MKNVKQTSQRLIYFLLSLVLLTACGGGGDDGSTTDTPTTTVTGFAISSVSPTSGATGVAVTTTISATFNKNITLVDGNKFTVAAGSTSVTGSVAASGAVLTFTPSSSLTAGTTYTATIAAGTVKDSSNTQNDAKSWSFSTTATESKTQFLIKPSNVNSTSTTSSVSTSGSTVKNVTVSLKSGNTEVTIDKGAKATASDCFELSRNADGSLRVASKTDAPSTCVALKAGDILKISADGFAVKEIVIDAAMLAKNGTDAKLKEVGSIQTKKLGDMTNNVIEAQSTRGAYTTVETEPDGTEMVTFETADGSVSLSMPADRVARMARNLKRTGLATDDTTISLEMTSIDPKTEGDSAVGDFSYNPYYEAGSSYNPSRATESARRGLSTAEREATVLESLVMANISMKADGTEIHCFSGDNSNFSETNQACTDGEEATIKIKVPPAQFERFAGEYNLGKRKVPLYSYDTRNGQWVRQTTNSGATEVDGELVLDDNNSNNKADTGDTLYLQGKVGHFSYWNGDWPMEKSCLSGTISGSFPTGTYVVVEGVNYAGRKFYSYLAENATSFSGIGVKKNAKAKVYLQYPDGGLSDIVYVQSGSIAYGSSTCQNTTEPNGSTAIQLTGALTTAEITVTVKDTDNNLLEGAFVGTTFGATVTGTDGTATVTVSTTQNTQVFVSYQTTIFESSKSIEVSSSSPSNQTVTLDISPFKITGKVTFTDENSKQSYPYGIVTADVSGDGLFGYSEIDTSNGTYTINLPRSAVTTSSNVVLNVYAYSTAYAKYLYKNETFTPSSSEITAKEATKDYAFAVKKYVVSGKVVDPTAAAGAQGVAGIPVWVSTGGFTTTDQNGFYQLTLFQGSADQKIYAWDTMMGELIKNAKSTTERFITISKNVISNQPDQNFKVDRKPAVLKGRVVNQKGVPPAGIQVFWSYGWESAYTDAKGNFEIKTFYTQPGQIYIFNENWELLKTAPVSGTYPPVKGVVKDFGVIQVNTNLPPVILNTSFNPFVPVVNGKITLTINAADPDNDPLTYEYSMNSGSGGTGSGSSNIVQITAPSTAGWMRVDLTVKDTSNASDQVTQWIYVKENAQPVIRSVNGVVLDWDKSSNMSITVNAFDPDGDALTYGAKLFNSFGVEQTSWGSVVSTTGAITINNDLADGDYYIRIKVGDGRSYTTATRWFRADSNTPPAITKIYESSDPTTDVRDKWVSIQSGSSVTFTVDATDDSGTPNIEWYVPSEASLSSGLTSQSVSFSISEEGIYSAAVLVYDAAWLLDYKIFYLDVQADQIPVIDEDQTGWKEPILIKNQSGTYSTPTGSSTLQAVLKISAEDPDGTSDNLAYCFGDLNGASFTPFKQVFVGDPTKAAYSLSNLDAGFYSVQYQVNDDNDSTCADPDQNVVGYATFEITEDNPPELFWYYVPISMTQGTTDTLFAYAEDPEGKTVTYSWSATDASGEAAGTFSDASSDEPDYTAPSSEGTVTMTLTISDGAESNNQTYTQNITIRGNQDPEIYYTDVYPTSLPLGGILYLSGGAYDDDNQLSSVVWKFRKSDASTDSVMVADASTDHDYYYDGYHEVDTSSLITETGQYNIWLEVISGGVTKKSTPVSVTFADANGKPTFGTPALTTSPTDTTVLPGESVTIIANATDPNGDTVSFEWYVDGYIVAETGSEFTFEEYSAGDYKISVYAFDGQEYSDASADVTITIQTSTLDATASPSNSIDVGSIFSLSAVLSNGTSIPSDSTWTVTTAPTGSVAEVSGTGSNVTFTPDQVGTYVIELEAWVFDEYYYTTITLSASAVVIPGTGDTVSGTVTTKADGIIEPISGAKVRLYHQTELLIYDETTTTDSNGYYEFNGVPAGTYILVIYAGTDYTTQAHIVSVGGE